MLDVFTTAEFWAPFLSSSAVAGIVATIFVPWYRARIEKAIQHKFDRQIEELRAGFRRDEERLKAELRDHESQMDALRSGALAQLSARRTALDSRRLRAVENLWAAVIAMGPAKFALQLTDRFQMDKIMDRNSGAVSASDAQKIGDSLWQTSGLEQLTQPGRPNGQTERPFVTPLTWALFSAYTGAIMYPAAQLTVLRTGLGGEVLNRASVILEPIREALPEHEKHIDQFGLSGLKFLVDALEKKVIAQLAAELQGDAIDSDAVQRAAKILEAADAAALALKPKAVIPAGVVAEKTHERP